MLAQAQIDPDAFRSLQVWTEHPALYAHEVFGFKAEPHQVEVMNAVAAASTPDAIIRGVTWRSCHGVGKTAFLAIMIFWFLHCHPMSKVLTTAPTWHQVKNVLWAEIHKWYDRCRFKWLFSMTTTTLKVVARPSEWMAIGVASNRPDRIEGFHAPFMMVVADEAKGIADSIFDALDGACTPVFADIGGQPGTRVYCSTPGMRIGKFYQSHTTLADRGLFHPFHTDGETIANPQYRQFVAQKAEEWGAESSIYLAKIRGQFPQEGEDILIPLDFIDAAHDAWHEVKCSECGKVDEECTHEGQDTEPAIEHGSKKVIGADIAAYGFNETAACFGSNARIDDLVTWQHEGPAASSVFLVSYRDRMKAGEWEVIDDEKIWRPGLIGIDATGIGAAVKEQFDLASVPHEAVMFGAAASELRKDQFANLKAEITFNFRAKLEQNYLARRAGGVGTFGLCPDDRMAGQLSNLRKRQKMVRGVPVGWKILDPDDPLIPAEDVPRGLKVSPDRAHAAIVCYHTANIAGTRMVGQIIDYEEKGRPSVLRDGFKRNRLGSMMGLKRGRD